MKRTLALAGTAVGTAVLGLALAAPASAQGFRGGHRDALGDQFQAQPQVQQERERVQAQRRRGGGGRNGGGNAGGAADIGTLTLIRWNEIAIDASGLDHTPVAPGEVRTFGEQLGPGRAARAMGIVHVAMFDALNAVMGNPFRSYTGIVGAAAGTSADAAIAQAAHDTLASMFPSQQPLFAAELARDLNAVPNVTARINGVALGRLTATAILARRANDGAAHPEPRMGVDFITSTEPGKWRQDPIARQPIALGAKWGEVRPMVLTSASQFRLPPPPALNSPEYAAAFNEVLSLGSDGTSAPTTRTPDQVHIGLFWAYDGTPSLCAPPRLYNQITTQIARQRGTTGIQLARLLALLNVSMADAGIASWESKFFYQVGRPITAIREATGSGSLDDGNPATTGNPAFVPLAAPASNLTGPNFTPPFPAYPSGHATFGGAVFQTLRNFYGTDQIAFTFVSEEFNGITRDNAGNIRPLLPRSYTNLSQPEMENGLSRIYLGIHWIFDATGGITQGRQIANFVFANAFQATPTAVGGGGRNRGGRNGNNNSRNNGNGRRG